MRSWRLLLKNIISEDHKQTDIAEMIGLTQIRSITNVNRGPRQRHRGRSLSTTPSVTISISKKRLKKRLGLKNVSVVGFAKPPNY